MIFGICSHFDVLKVLKLHSRSYDFLHCPKLIGSLSLLSGSMVGFVVISRFLSIFVELGVQTSLTILDKRWVGNWWLGFAIFGALCVFWSIWLLGFPKEFPLTKKLWEGSRAEPIAKDVSCLLVGIMLLFLIIK